VEAYVKTGEAPPLPDDLPDELKTARAGVFVSLKIAGSCAAASVRSARSAGMLPRRS
jgi:hypothetical protein